MSGYVGDLSPEQEEALRKLRAAVADIPDKPEDDDYFYLRWLRARKFKVRKAEEMLRKHMENRRKYKIDSILTDWTPPEGKQAVREYNRKSYRGFQVLKKYLPGGWFGEDRDGHPVWYDHVDADAVGIMRSATKEDIGLFKCMHGEEMVRMCRELSAKKGKRIETVTCVYDFEMLSIKRHFHWPVIELIREILSQFEANYPERVKAVFAIRTPSFFPMGYNLVKHFIDAKTRQKIHILGANWQEVVHKYISPDQMPQVYGGTRCEPDPWCTNYITHNTDDIPPEYYLTNLTETSREEMKRVVVGRGSVQKIRCEVTEPRSVLKWEFISVDYDIAFGVYHKSDKKQKEQVVAHERKESHIMPESGVYRCEKPGTYVLKFDNSYSWTRPKEVFYSVKVLPPDTELPLPTVPNSGSDSEDEFFDCMADPLDQPVLQTGLTSSAEVTEVEPEGATGTSVTVLRTSISTTV